jgi:hypothetical protein
MTGDDRSRFCSHCNLNVYNISAMSRSEAESLIASAEGRLCVRYYRRKDGTVMTQDCPVGAQQARLQSVRSVRRLLTAGVTLVAGMIGLGASQSSSSQKTAFMGRMTITSLSVDSLEQATIRPVPDTVETEEEERPVVMGVMVFEPIEPSTENQESSSSDSDEYSDDDVLPVTLDDIALPPSDSTGWEQHEESPDIR